MKKRIWNKVVSIFTAILLVVGIVPNTTITALAAENAPSTLIVGNVTVDTSQGGYWTTDTDGNLAPGNESNYNVHYDTGSNTLTLNSATITGEYDVTNNPSNAGIYASASADQPVSLTIVLQGDNKVSGSIGVYVYSSTTGTASLTIAGGGSLNASGYANSGIWVLSYNGNATLTIQNAEVETTETSVAGDGVRIQAGESSNASLSVEGGSLTATGKSEYGAGIQYFFGSSSSGSGTPSLTVSNNAIVKASGGTSGITSNSSPVTPSGTGIVFNNGTGTVYGSVTLQEGLEIGEGESLTLDDGASLDANGYNVIVDGGIVDDNIKNSLGDSMKYTPTITTTSLPNGTVGTHYEQKLTSDGTEPIKWNVTDGNLPTGLNLSTNGKITGIPTAPGDYVFTVTASNDAGSVSKELTITVKDVDPIYSIQNSGDISFANAIEGYTPEVKTIMITNDGNQPITLNQPSSTSFDVGTLSKIELNVGETAEFTVQPKNGLLAGSYEEDIVITGTNNGKSVSTKVNVKFNVKHNAIKVERKDPTCTEKGNIEYWYCEACRKYFQDEALTKELKQEETIVPATGHNLTKVDEKKPTVDAAGNIEYWYCEVCNKYFSDEKAEHEITLEDTIIAKLPKFVSGANQEWTKGSKDGLTFKIDTDINEFKKVLVDGKELKDTDYDIKSGSTILTLKPSFLDTLSAGKHKIRFEFNTGSVEAYFTVKDKENSSQTESANTGVQNKYGLWIVLLLVAAGGLAGFGILSKRRKNHK